MRGILGADIFINLLLVFIITTGLLMMNSNRVAQVTYSEKPVAGESIMPKVDLAEGKAGGLPAGTKKESVTISVKKTEKGVEYFLNTTTVVLKDLSRKLKEKGTSKAEIRIEGEIPYMHYIRILDICKQSGITEIYNVYRSSQQPEG